jgi:multidrug efflux pump subunit AcrA (membrane-fusion protein)
MTNRTLSSRPRTMRSGTTAGILLSAAMLPLGACGAEEPAASAGSTAGTPVAAMQVMATSIQEDRSWSGSLAPFRANALRAPSEARIGALAVQDGDRVGTGDLLMRLEGVDVEARGEVLSEREELLRAELGRWQALAAQGAAGPGEVSAAELRLLEAREARAGVESLRESLVLRASGAGRVVALSVSPGMQVGAGQPLMVLEEDGSWGVRLRVAAEETRWFQDPARLQVVGSLGLRAGVSRVVQGPDPVSGFVQVDLYLGAPVANEAGAAPSPGAGVASARQGAVVRYLDQVEALVIPWTAVASDGNRSWVALAVPDPSGDGGYQVERRTVELGAAREDGIEVVEGIQPGDIVIRYEPRSHPEGRRVDPRLSGDEV